MTSPIQILVVDDDPEIREMLSDYLSDQGYIVLQASNGTSLRNILDEQAPHIVLLDVHMPGEDGLTLARYVREHYDIGIIMVSGAGDTMDRIIGLEVGADDYVAKPFDPRELRARIKSVLRRYQRTETLSLPTPEPETTNQRIKIGDHTLDLISRELRDSNGIEISLTSAEFDLLRVFVERPNRPLSRDQILGLTQNREWDPFDRSVDIRIARLRRKIESSESSTPMIKTVRGIGYMYVPRNR